LTCLDQILGLDKFLPVEMLTAALAFDDLPFDRPRVNLGDVFSDLGDLIIETSFVLMLGANARDDQNVQEKTILRNQGWIQRTRHAWPPYQGRRRGKNHWHSVPMKLTIRENP
jgi:hypothetical protein